MDDLERLQLAVRRLLDDIARDCHTGIRDSFCECPAHVRVRNTAAEVEALLYG